MKKAVFSFLAVLAVIFCIPAAAYATFDKTADDAVAWVMGHEEGVGYEYDGAVDSYINGELWIMTNQCVDLIRGYMDYISGTHTRGNAGTYTYNDLPEGYDRIQKYDGFVPAKGDILIWSGEPGHVAICTAVNSQWEIVYSDQNGDGSYKKVKHGRTMNPQENDYWGVIRPEFKPISFIEPTVYTLPIGKEVDISWNDVGASSYYVYVQSKNNQSIPYGNNVGRTFSIHLGLNEGDFVAYVTAVYSSDNMKTGYSEFSTKELCPSINKGKEETYHINEPVVINMNTDVSTVDSCVLKIYRTPTDGETFLYWEGQVFSSQYTTSFLNEGHYSCCYILTRNNHSVESEWVGWNIKDDNLCAFVDKGQNGEYYVDEPVEISINAEVSTVDSCVLKIYRTPADGQTYLYWEGQVFTPQYITSFTHEGYYSCCFILEYNNIWTESEWVGWSVKVPITSTYLVQYDANGGTDAPLSQNKIHDTALTLSSDEPKREASTGRYTVRFKTIEEDGTTIFYNPVSVPWTTSYTFKNWNTDKYGTGTSYAPGATYTANASATLYAQWNSTKTTGSVPLPDSPTRSGYVFMGWATRYGASRGNFGSYTPTRDGDVTLYATWKKMDIVLPEALNEIESEAFDGCAFSSVMLSEKTATISGRAFVDCPNLKYIYIPAATTAIAADAFAGVDGLTILGAHGSYAETYADAHGYTFIAVH